MVSSIIYAIAVFIIGVIIYFFDLFATANLDGVRGSRIFNMYLCVVGTAWLLWLKFDISNYAKNMEEYKNVGTDSSKFKLVEGKNGFFFGLGTPRKAEGKKHHSFIRAVGRVLRLRRNTRW